jgi:hypothetical protein
VPAAPSHAVGRGAVPEAVDGRCTGHEAGSAVLTARVTG